MRHADVYTATGTHNVLYVASDHLELPGFDRALPGGGRFTHCAPILQLTAPGASRSVWRLPACFAPSAAATLSYHGNPGRWHLDRDGVLLHSVGRGQEFVLDCDTYPGVYDWLGEVFAASADCGR